MNDLYPELETYIFRFCGEFQTHHEVMAYKTVLYHNLSDTPAHLLKLMKETGQISDDPEVLAMMVDGRDALRDRIVRRVWEQHRQELSLNLCPVCGKIARTPKARQCQFCYHNWH
ncbi:hypothetical protein SAMN05428949_4820 [Chitinophaga sp. YR627]|nr:hypothetical protein SAMN05428949_4820 [Chitinophaga sp. YR627]